MAPVSNALRTCGLIFPFILQVYATGNNIADFLIQSVKVGSVSCDEINCKYLLNVSGGEFLGHHAWRLTPEEGVNSDNCDITYPNYEIKEIKTSQWVSEIEVSVPKNVGKIFFCLRQNTGNAPFGGKWVHQGFQHFLDPINAINSLNENKLNIESETTNPSHYEDLQAPKDNEIQESQSWTDLSHDTDVNYLPNKPRVTREEKKDIEVFINNLRQSKDNSNKDIYPKPNIEENDEALIKSINNDNIKTGINERLIKKKRSDTETNKDAHSKSEVENDEDLIEKGNNDNTVASINEKIFKYGQRDVPQLREEFARSNNLFYQDLIHNVEQALKINDNNNSLINRHVNKRDTNIVPVVHKEFSNISDKLNNKEYSEFIGVQTESHTENDLTTEGVKDVKITKRQISKMLEVEFTGVKSGLVDIEGIRIENSDKEPKIVDDGIPSVLADSAVTLRVYGEGLTPRTVIAFTHDPQLFGQPCKFLLKGEYMVKEGSLRGKTALFDIKAPAPITGDKLYICAKTLRPGVTDPREDEEKYLHQGTETWKMMACHTKLLPLWVTICLILVCLMFSALFSGLNLGLMSLDRTELKIIANTGTEQERKYARAIMPVRDHGNYLLCSILLGNVAVNSTFTILLDELTSGLFAVIFSTLAIVLLGEITPQAICSRHGLMVGAKSIMVTKAVMAVTAPLSFPVSKLLDYFLGEEIGSVYNRERLKELVKVMGLHVTTGVNDLDKDEVNIISGALELRKKTVCDVMTKLEDVFMLPISSVLDFETMSEIIKSGYSRIPVYEGSRGNILTVLFIKDLAFVDPDDNTPLRTLCQYYQNPCNFVFEDVTLDVMFKQFKEGHKGHMAFVHRINNEGEGDPFYETIGLVTLEDVIEEMIQAEIVDETDVFTDNRSKRRRNRPTNKLQDFAAFAEKHDNQRIHISPQLTLATFQFLSTSVDAFKPDTVSETVLRRLLRQDVIQYIKIKGKTKKDVSTYVFQQGKPVDYFVLILEGRVEVTVGRENLVFEAGPFTYFGVQALTQNIGVAESPTPSAMGSLQNINMDAMLRHTFVPDYSVRAITSVYYLTVKRSLYLAAKRATLMEKGNISKGGTNEQFDTEVDKLLQSVDEDLSITGEHKTPSRQVSPHPVPVSPAPRASEPRNGHAYAPTADEQERLLK